MIRDRPRRMCCKALLLWCVRRCHRRRLEETRAGVSGFRHRGRRRPPAAKAESANGRWLPRRLGRVRRSADACGSSPAITNPGPSILTVPMAASAPTATVLSPSPITPIARAQHLLVPPRRSWTSASCSLARPGTPLNLVFCSTPRVFLKILENSPPLTDQIRRRALVTPILDCTRT